MNRGYLFSRSAGMVVAVAILAVPILGQPEKRTMAETLTIIADPSWGARDSTRRRFQFLLNWFEGSCTDFKNQEQVGNSLAAVHKLMMEAGLDAEEGILKSSNNLYRLTVEITTSKKEGKAACTELWTLYVSMRRGGFPPDHVIGAIKAFVTNTQKAIRPKAKKATPPKPTTQQRRYKSKDKFFLEAAGQSRKLIMQGHENILDVGIGGDGADGWVLFVEVSRGTPTQYAKTVGDDSLYILAKKFADFGPADYEVTVTRAGTPWESKTYASPIWRGKLKKGARKVHWEQIIGEERVGRVGRKKPKDSVERKGEDFDAVYDNIFPPPSRSTPNRQ